ncbi:uncharacterized protein LOC112213568 [Bombus impatiens]|uniref:Uncharacterized protein LOC112213568 n=1 Tax=Bombus impatiens TaxID=132113 RepID=A0A6P6FGZ7_BOMIM|nr:uncharacterized protein LOC112213568 [Bombus impatiens]
MNKQRRNPHGQDHERTPQKHPTMASATHRMQFTRRCQEVSSTYVQVPDMILRSKTILLTEIIHTDCLHINNGFIKEAAFSAIPSWTTCLASSSNEDIEHEGLRLVS